MARIRTIKPEFFTSEDIVALSPMARLLYIALWCEADREGRFAWRPLTFKLRYLPADTCDVHALCAELTGRGLVVQYGDGLAYIPQFRAHQHINPREADSRYPSPDDDANPGDARPAPDNVPLSQEGDEAANPGPQANTVANATPPADDAHAPPLPPGNEAASDASARVGHASARVGHASARVSDAQGGRERKGRERNTPLNSGVERARPRATRLPADWSLPDEWRCWAEQARPDLDIRLTADRFADHWRSAPGQRGLKADWLATWRNWVRSERPPPRASQVRQTVAAESFREREERLQAERVAQFAPALANRAAMVPRSDAAVFDLDAKEMRNVVAIGGR